MSYVSLPGTGTTRINTPDSAALSLTGDLDVRGLFLLADWTPSATQTVLSHFLATGNQRSWLLRVGTSGVLSFLWSADGSATLVTVNSTAATGRGDGLFQWLRVTHDVDNGSTQNVVTFYTSTDPINTAPASVTWGQLGTAVTNAGVVAHHDSTALLNIGAHDAGASGKMVGNAYYAELRSSIAGTIVGSPDFRDATQITTPYTVFTDGQSNAWTLQTAAVWIFEGTGTGALTLAGVTSAGAGTYTPGAITGTGAITLAGVVSAGVGVASGMGPIPGGGGARMGGNAIRKPPRLNVIRRRR